MKIQVLSDLHLEFRLPSRRNKRGVSRKDLEEVGVQFSEEADVYVLAGDICTVQTLPYILDALGEVEKPKVYVPGNHEFYGSSVKDTLCSLRSAFDKTNTYILERDVLDIDGIKFIGTCLWTEVDPSRYDEVKKWMNDFWMVEGLTPEIWNRMHIQAVDYIKLALSSYRDRKSIVVTHTSPSYQSMSLRFAGSPMNCLFHNNLDFMVEEYSPEVWIHGHTHDAFDYRLFNTRVVCNPLGYPREHDVPQYNPQLIIEV